MTRTRSALVVVLVVLVVAVMPAAGARSVSECALLTETQAAKIMGTKPFSSGTPDNGGCSWETDPADRANGVAFVTLKVEPAKQLLERYNGDLRTYLDQSTNVGIDLLPGVGDEAFSTYSPLSGPGSADGFTVLIGKQVLDVGVQPVERLENPSPEFDRVVKIVKKMVAKVRSTR